MAEWAAVVREAAQEAAAASLAARAVLAAQAVLAAGWAGRGDWVALEAMAAGCRGQPGCCDTAWTGEHVVVGGVGWECELLALVTD